MKLKRKFADPMMSSVLAIYPPWVHLFVIPVLAYYWSSLFQKLVKKPMFGLIRGERENGMFIVVKYLSL